MYPFIPIGSTANVPTYYLILSLGLCLSLWWLHRRVQKTKLSPRTALDLSLVLMVCGFIGGRLFHVIYEEWDYYSVNPGQIFAFWNGGFVYFGGAILAALGGIAFIQHNDKKNLRAYMDLFAPLFAFTYAVGRVGCFLAGCCYGRFCDLPWAVNGLHPTQLYAVFWELGVLIVLLDIERMAGIKRPPFLRPLGSLFFIWLILHGLGRLIMESFRADFRGATFGISISSWLSLLAITIGVYYLAKNNNVGPKT